MLTLSPLRYPGGKARVTHFFELIFRHNGLMDGEYIEPFAGGASVALGLLFGCFARRIHINDADPSIFAFWDAVLNNTDELCGRVRDARMDIEEWRRQRDIYRAADVEPIERAFATFYLNRTNRSGVIVKGGVIGGQKQDGPWKMDARFTKDELVKRIDRVARFKDQITLTQLDATVLLADLAARQPARPALVYLDPPYFHKADTLYRNFYRTREDHQALADAVDRLPMRWVVSYDNVPEVRELYASKRHLAYGLRYTARERYEGREVMFFSPGLRVPAVDSPVEVTLKMVQGRDPVRLAG